MRWPREQARVRRRRRAKLRGHGDEFMEMNVEVDPDWGAPRVRRQSRRPRHPISAPAARVRRNVRKGAVSETAGLTMLAGDEFGGADHPHGAGHLGGEHDRPNKAGAADDDL
ncbi:pPE family protein [Mycobacterium xenopi 3993]|nr:pPE family protein [Mycobacterium xenopi 3993]